MTDERLIFRARVEAVEVNYEEDGLVWRLELRYQDSELAEEGKSQVAGTMLPAGLAVAGDLEETLTELLAAMRMALIKEVGNPSLSEDPRPALRAEETPDPSSSGEG